MRARDRGLMVQPAGQAAAASGRRRLSSSMRAARTAAGRSGRITVGRRATAERVARSRVVVSAPGAGLTVWRTQRRAVLALRGDVR